MHYALSSDYEEQIQRNCIYELLYILVTYTTRQDMISDILNLSLNITKYMEKKPTNTNKGYALKWNYRASW